MRYAHNKWTRQPFPSAASVAGGGFALVALVIAWAVLTETPERVRSPITEMAQAPATQAVVTAPSIPASQPARLVYRYSVIPGGVHSAAELASALRADPAAAAHYAGFDVAAARSVRVEKSRLVHVSYRIGDKIYWTRNKVRLAAGEELLSDGTNLVRARCGNRIADEPQSIIFDNEPAPGALDALMVSADGLVEEGDEMPAGGYGMPQAAPAQGVEQPSAVRLASNMRFGAPLPMPSSRGPTPGSALTAPPPVSVSKPASTPTAPRPTDSVFAVAPPPASPVQLPAGPTGVAPSPPAAVPGTPVPATPAPGSPTPVRPGPTAKPRPSPPAVPAPDSHAPSPLEPTVGPHPVAPEAPTPIPEPGSAALVAVALAAIGVARRRRKHPAGRAQEH